MTPQQIGGELSRLAIFITNPGTCEDIMSFWERFKELTKEGGNHIPHLKLISNRCPVRDVREEAKMIASSLEREASSSSEKQVTTAVA